MNNSYAPAIIDEHYTSLCSLLIENLIENLIEFSLNLSEHRAKVEFILQLYRIIDIQRSNIFSEVFCSEKSV